MWCQKVVIAACKIADQIRIQAPEGLRILNAQTRSAMVAQRPGISKDCISRCVQVLQYRRWLLKSHDNFHNYS